MRYCFTLLLLLSMTIVHAQERPSSPIITAENINQLQSAHQLDFADISIPEALADTLENPVPSVDLGWFIYSQASDRFLLIDTTNRLYIVTTDGIATDIIENVNVIDAAVFGDDLFAVLLTTESGYAVWYDDFYHDSSAVERQEITVDSENFPAAIWVTCPDNADVSGVGCYANVEITTTADGIIQQMPPFGQADSSNTLTPITELFYAPAQDSDAVVRIGRIPFPYVVTSTLDGQVSLWNLETESRLYTVDNATDVPSVFGNINTPATHLIWRDNPNETLYLLDFETRENTIIASLEGDYAQWYFLSNDATVAIAVNLGGEPNVIAWDITSGTQMDLGTYRECERPQPDMTRLTPDGTTLIIGCDSGLDIWRVMPVVP